MKHADWRWRDVASTGIICALTLAVGWQLFRVAQPTSPPTSSPISNQQFAEELHKLTTSYAQELEVSIANKDQSEVEHIYQEWNTRRRTAIEELHRKHLREAPVWVD